VITDSPIQYDMTLVKELRRGTQRMRSDGDRSAGRERSDFGGEQAADPLDYGKARVGAGNQTADSANTFNERSTTNVRR
jgi:hypothetical protein